MDRVHKVIADIEPHDSVERYTGLGVEVLQGFARLIDPWTVEIKLNDGGVQRLTTRAIIIATGAAPFVPPLPGIDEVGYLTSDTLWERLRERETAPKRLVVRRRADRIGTGSEFRAARLLGHPDRDGAPHHDPRGRGSLRAGEGFA